MTKTKPEYIVVVTNERHEVNDAYIEDGNLIQIDFIAVGSQFHGRHYMGMRPTVFIDNTTKAAYETRSKEYVDDWLEYLIGSMAGGGNVKVIGNGLLADKVRHIFKRDHTTKNGVMYVKECQHKQRNGADNMTKSNTRVYLAGDMLKRGSQLLREQERSRLAQVPGIHVHNPADDKEINDKSRTPRAEEIFRKDTEAILESDVVIFDADDDSVGTTTEIGQVWGVNYMHRRLTEALINSDGTDADFGKRVRKLLQEIPYKEVYWQCTDIRNVPNAEERGLRRSYSLNQYLYGCLLDMAGMDSTFDEIVEELEAEVANG